MLQANILGVAAAYRHLGRGRVMGLSLPTEEQERIFVEAFPEWRDLATRAFNASQRVLDYLMAKEIGVRDVSRVAGKREYAIDYEAKSTAPRSNLL